MFAWLNQRPVINLLFGVCLMIGLTLLCLTLWQKGEQVSLDGFQKRLAVAGLIGIGLDRLGGYQAHQTTRFAWPCILYSVWFGLFLTAFLMLSGTWGADDPAPMMIVILIVTSIGVQAVFPVQKIEWLDRQYAPDATVRYWHILWPVGTMAAAISVWVWGAPLHACFAIALGLLTSPPVRDRVGKHDPLYRVVAAILSGVFALLYVTG